MNKLQVMREVSFGVYLDGEELGEILLPRRYLKAGCSPGATVDVFVFLDSEDRLVAVTDRPKAMVGDVAMLKVVSVTGIGAFLDWGLPKDLLVPFREQSQKMQEGKSYVVCVYLDETSNRIAASSRLDAHIEKRPMRFKDGQEVKLLICQDTDLGYKALINGTHLGLLFKNEVLGSVTIGSRVPGFIKAVRTDGKIDLSMQKEGMVKVDDVTEMVLDYLKRFNGFMAMNEKSSPQAIYELFGTSKKTYKRAIGALYKKRLIAIEEGGIRLVEK